jgi:hypothetical protein
MPDSPVVNEVEQPTKSKAEAVAEVVRMRDELKKKAEQQFSGAASAATATMLLDKTEAERQNPGKRIRWVSLRNEQKAQIRQQSGYVRLAAEEGGRQVGSLVLMALPAEEHARRVEQIKKNTQERVVAHNKEAEQMAEGIAKELRDRHGISISPEHIYGQVAGESGRR